MKTKILLVDDEVDLKDLFTRKFRHQIQANTYEFVFVHDGLEALTVLKQQPDIDLVLSDINMPGMDGLTLLARLPEINPVVRTVIVTAYGDMDNIRTAMNRGAFDFITKPINFSDLDVTIEKTRRHVSQLRETAELKAVDEMKTRFFANITHELRTPLTLIVSPVDKLLETADLPALYQQQLTAVRRNARQLLRLINQLLDINKLEARQMNLVDEVGDLPGFVGQVVDLFRPSADIKNIVLTYETDLLPGNYVFDAGKWEKILYNLLANAIKFTPAGTITVGLRQTPSGVRLAVADTGIGVTPAKLPRIFDRFYQIDDARTRSYEGSGIGLALVNELTSRLGGSIRVESRAQETDGLSGTQFTLDIPVRWVNGYVDAQSVAIPTLVVDLPHVPGSVVAADPPGTPDAMPLVLVVEDNAELREFIVAELATTYRVRSAANGYEGWVVAKEELPDVVISDLMMPRMDGYALTERLKTDPATDHIAVVLLTASTEQDSRLKGFAHGADDYLTKPFHVGELHLRLRNLLNRQQKLREQYRQQLARPDVARPDEAISAPMQTVPDQFLHRVHQLVEQRLDDSSLSVEWVADQLAMSRKTLYLKVHTLTHLSPVELIRQYRLRKAVDLLRLGHNASETAYLVGFESPSYFSKVFREFYQQTPTDYLKR